MRSTRGVEPGTFRLKLGDLQYADMVFPLGGHRDSKGHSSCLARISRRAKDRRGPVRRNFLRKRQTGPPMVGSRAVDRGSSWGTFPKTVEQADAANPQAVSVPAAIDGRLLKPHEEDRYLLSVTPGQTLRFDVLAARAGSPLDGVLMVRKESGEQLAAADDQPSTTDPVLDFKVPDGVDKIVVAVKDLLDRGGPEFAYRLAVAAADRPDFRLELFADREQCHAAALRSSAFAPRAPATRGPSSSLLPGCQRALLC